MHKMIVLYPAPTDPDHFREYYVSTHVPLVAKLPGILAWRYSFDVKSAPGAPEYFAIFEADFADGAAMGAAMGSPEGAAVRADVTNYASGGSFVLNYAVQTS
ncbi:EthD family reductase [Amycolatopsis sp.]|jgi:uncharacterized protein (TIGR02118 family)|uniref:EthD family reductase n=1 Tax=Amycolatopsis sp. TaxID=37632 RepID=UPI002603CAD8|nr:EthD family reductase [Amycolatopsis sp.]